MFREVQLDMNESVKGTGYNNILSPIFPTSKLMDNTMAVRKSKCVGIAFCEDIESISECNHINYR